MHITFTREQVQETRINLNLSVEEATALYWAIDPNNQHMKRWIPAGHREAFADIAEDIEGEVQARLVDTGNNPDVYAVTPPLEVEYR